MQRNAEPVAISADATLERLISAFGGGEDAETVGRRSLGSGMRVGEGGDFLGEHALGFTRGIGCTGGKQHEPRGHHAVGFGGEPKNGSSQLAQKSMAISRHRIATWHEASQHERRSVAQIV